MIRKDWTVELIGQHQSLLALQADQFAWLRWQDASWNEEKTWTFQESRLERFNFCDLYLADEFDAYIIVSFVNATLVLSIGETVEEVTDSGFLGTTPTLSCSLLGDNALVQVYPDGIRHIRSDKRVNEWKAPGKKMVMKCAVNNRQVVIALSGGELVYFEMDPVSAK